MNRNCFIESSGHPEPPARPRSDPWGLRVAAAVAIAAVACGCEIGDAPAADLGTEARQDKFYVRSSTLWSPGRHNAFTNLSVCFENSSDATADGWVKDALTATWDADSWVNFSGFGSCANGGTIRVRIEDTAALPHTDGLGTDYGKIYLNYTFINSIPSCATSAKRKGCIQTIAIHEFGHALGLAHEQNRPSFTACADGTKASTSGSNGDLSIGAFDHASIMSPCPEGTWTGWLSTADSANIKRLYGPQVLSHGQKMSLRAQAGQYLSVRLVSSFPSEQYLVSGSASSQALEVRRRSGAGGIAYGDDVSVYDPGTRRYVCFGWVVDSFGNGAFAGVASANACYFKVGHTNGTNGGSAVDVNDPFTLTATAGGSTQFLGIDKAYLSSSIKTEWRFNGPF